MKGGLGGVPRGLEYLIKEQNSSETETIATPEVITQPAEPVVEVKKSVAIAENAADSIDALKAQIAQISEMQKLQALLLQKELAQKLPAPKKPAVLKGAQRGLQAGYTRSTFIIKQEYFDMAQALAYIERTSIKTVINKALAAYLKSRDVRDEYRQALAKAARSE